jgi:hypothetical protein
MRNNVLVIVFLLLAGGTAGAREIGLPLVKPPGIFSTADYAAALRGQPSPVKLNCSPAAHARAYNDFFAPRGVEISDLPALMESLEIRPLPAGARVRAVGLTTGSCAPFDFERSVRPGEMGIFSTNTMSFIGSASCGNALEVLEAAPSMQRARASVPRSRTPWINEHGDGLDWGTGFRDMPDESARGQAQRTLRHLGGAALGAAGFAAGMALHPGTKIKQTISNAMSSGGSPGVPQPPAPPPNGGPVNPAPVPPSGTGGGPRNPAP